MFCFMIRLDWSVKFEYLLEGSRNGVLLPTDQREPIDIRQRQLNNN